MKADTDLLRRRAGADVPVVGDEAKQTVPNAAANDICGVAGSGQGVDIEMLMMALAPAGMLIFKDVCFDIFITLLRQTSITCAEYPVHKRSDGRGISQFRKDDPVLEE